VTGRQNVEQFVQLLTKPLDIHTPVTVLTLDNYAALMPFLDYPTRLRVAKTVAGAVIRRGKALREPEKVVRLFGFLAPLMRDEPDAPAADEDDFAEEQGLVARLVHLVDSPDTDVVFQARVP
jgi:vacuolar protein sorting-associated protein 35